MLAPCPQVATDGRAYLNDRDPDLEEGGARRTGRIIGLESLKDLIQRAALKPSFVFWRAFCSRYDFTLRPRKTYWREGAAAPEWRKRKGYRWFDSTGVFYSATCGSTNAKKPSKASIHIYDTLAMLLSDDRECLKSAQFDCLSLRAMLEKSVGDCRTLQILQSPLTAKAVALDAIVN